MVILVAEDDDGHAELICDGLRQSGVCNKILRFVDGREVWEFLDGTASGDVRDPDKSYLLLLDIRMPRMDGVEVLTLIKGDGRLKEIVVIMLTTTDDPLEVKECYRLGCNVYITKPVAFHAFAETLNRLGLFIQVVKL